ncbi:ParB N-terminal domain-containing protein [Paenibacillus thiaminolyticus]|uniref:ParB N-terminal domain-containing protein n=1 Tax=Paenibacillus thiaminolyticus TaxID=49283 RepID=UPI002543D8FC|nr:ParB N-terminal domain-containing protein [Paenibacillus thiaminolyticus]WII36834.1 chromosome partitioning protein ParB [Paenibacillus thiaminolyticus]
MDIRTISIERINAAAYNPRVDLQPDDPEYQKLRRSIEEFGYVEPIVWNERTGNMVGGHQRFKILVNEQGRTEVEVSAVDLDETQERLLNLALNKVSGRWDDEALTKLINELESDGADLSLSGFDLDEVDNLKTEYALDEIFEEELENEPSSLVERFGVPPFTVFDARQGYWQDRKRAWLGLGIKSEDGRKDTLLYNLDKQSEYVRKAMEACGGGTSVFDPVLCEIVYRWFCPQDGRILDPFAGGSVRGIVAHYLGYSYTGIDLRPEQVEANRKQADKMLAEGVLRSDPEWIQGDSINIKKLAGHVQADLIFSCPPYADLEVYSDDPADLSNMEYEGFLTAYRQIIADAVSQLKENRFACFVVGDVRDKRGLYRNFVSHTIQAFTDAGMHLYNEGVLLNSVGTVALRVGRQFTTMRKLGKCHQNVLFFFKGNPKMIKEEFSYIEVDTDIFEKYA